MSQSPPTTLGKYQIIREIARSNDIVYEAYDPVMNRRVALKELSMPGGASQQQQEDRIKRFLREARAAGSLVHGNIVTIYEFGEDAGRRFIAMEYLDGQNLRNLLDTKGFIEPQRAVEIAIEVLKGLEFAHSHGVIHRDIKPDNIQLLENGETKITDFGIARLTFEPNLTMDGQVFGTPSYMSPEQINGRDIDARSDLFSVGVILYEMVAGQKPFTGDSVVSITYAIMNQDPQQPSQCGPGLWQVIRQAIDKSPQLRWGSAKEMATALQQVLEQMKSGGIVATPFAGPGHATQMPQIAAGPPPVQQPYGGGMTPYGTPLPGAISQQPYGTPYNAGQPYPLPQQGQPYSSQPYAGQPYGAQPYNPQQPNQQPYIPVPVYYPPPPRGPVFSPETRVFMGRLIKAFLLVGTIVAIAVTAIVQGANALGNQKKPSKPVPQAALTQPRSVEEHTTAEPPVEVFTIDSAQAAVDRAKDEPDASTRRGLWSQASRVWSTIVSSGDPNQLNRLAVASFLDAAKELAQKGETDKAAEAVYEAEGFASSDPNLALQVQDWKAALNR